MKLLLIILVIILISECVKNKEKNNQSDKSINTNIVENFQCNETKITPDINYSKYYKRDYVMTQTELIFYRKLKEITDKLELTIFPEVDLERIIKVYNDESAYRNRIKSRCIDYTIVNNKNCKIICCIELDDYTHNRYDRQKRDDFINALFENVGLKLFRVKVGNYNLEEIENNIKEAL